MARRDNRTALLQGARACLDAQGYARTRARDVAAASDVSLSAIGYHFGTTEALLVEALVDGIEEWSAHVAATLPDARATASSADAERAWSVLLGSLPRWRGVLAASYELIAQADRDDAVRDRLREVLRGARTGLARQLLGTDVRAEDAERLGAVCYALLSGTVVQWLVDEDSLPDPADLARATIALV